MTDLIPFADVRPDHLPAVGGKGLSLGLLSSAGLPVPPGFCLTTAAFLRLRGRPPGDDPALAAALADAYRLLGQGVVAVRSSATAEDGADASFAGQQETYLGVEGDGPLRDAVAGCWASLDGERAVAYRRRQGVAEDGLAMAVVVQRLVDAEVAGVLFTRDPLDPAAGRMLAEASWGLGEAVVSGRVTPDRYHLDRDTGRLLDRHVSLKTVRRTRDGESPVPHDLQGVACLDDAQLAALAELGRRVEAFYGDARDVEWAYADGRFWLLQARPITAAGRDDRERVRREEIDALRARAEPRGTVWSRFNLSEILPEPTPMTWAIVRRHLMSGKGGFGMMYRDLGYDPSPLLDDDGIFDLVCGRPYCNLSREPLLYGKHVPFEHPFAALKKDPGRAMYPTPVINPARWGALSLLTMPFWMPWLTWNQMTSSLTRQRLTKTFASSFVARIAPAFLAWTRHVRDEDLTECDDERLLAGLGRAAERTLEQFARESLKPTALAALAMASLEQKLAAVVGTERARDVARDLAMGLRPDPEADLGGAVRDLAEGRRSRADFLAAFGHRAGEEMELSMPRWEEEPESLPEGAPAEAAPRRAAEPSPEERLAAIPRLAAFQREVLLDETRAVHQYVKLREAGKHYLMYGYALVRRLLCEIDRRANLRGGVFYLTPDELPRLLKGDDLSATISQRRKRRALALGLEAPPVIFSDDLEAVGRAMDLSGADLYQGVALSAGVAEGPALVLEHPHGRPPAEGYVLVCPSTDPAWVPLFVRAKALVMETGGVLSHGAIVAREFGLPAVAGVAGAVRRFRTGQRLRVDGGRGTVSVLDAP